MSDTDQPATPPDSKSTDTRLKPIPSISYVPVPEGGGDVDWFRVDALLSDGRKYGAYHHPVHNPFKLCINGETKEVRSLQNTHAAQPSPTDARAIKDTWNKAIEMALEHVKLPANQFFGKYGTSLLETAMAYARNDAERAALSSTPRAEEFERRAREAALEEAARIVEQPFAGIAHTEQEQRWRIQLVNQLAREIRARKHFTATDVEQEERR